MSESQEKEEVDCDGEGKGTELSEDGEADRPVVIGRSGDGCALSGPAASGRASRACEASLVVDLQEGP